MKKAIGLTTIALALLQGCITSPEPKIRKIDCGTLDLSEPADSWGPWSPIDTLSVKGGECS